MVKVYLQHWMKWQEITKLVKPSRWHVRNDVCRCCHDDKNPLRQDFRLPHRLARWHSNQCTELHLPLRTLPVMMQMLMEIQQVWMAITVVFFPEALCCRVFVMRAEVRWKAFLVDWFSQFMSVRCIPQVQHKVKFMPCWVDDEPKLYRKCLMKGVIYSTFNANYLRCRPLACRMIFACTPKAHPRLNWWWVVEVSLRPIHTLYQQHVRK